MNFIILETMIINLACVLKVSAITNDAILVTYVNGTEEKIIDQDAKKLYTYLQRKSF